MCQVSEQNDHVEITYLITDNTPNSFKTCEKFGDVLNKLRKAMKDSESENNDDYDDYDGDDDWWGAGGFLDD